MSDRYTSTDARTAVARLARTLGRSNEAYTIDKDGRTRGNVGAIVLSSEYVRRRVGLPTHDLAEHAAILILAISVTLGIGIIGIIASQ